MNDLSYRAEVANQIVLGLSRLDADRWPKVLAAAEPNELYVGLAHELALHAIDMFEEDYDEDGRRLLETRLQDAAALYPPMQVNQPVAAVSQQILAEGLVLAVLLKDTKGFNRGAYRELTNPFVGVIDIAEAEREARRVLNPDLGDFSSIIEPHPRPDRSAPPQSDSKSA